MTEPLVACPTCRGSGVVLDSKAVGNEVRRKREATGVSLNKFAKRAGMSNAHLSMLETGKRRWTPERYRQVLSEIENLRKDQKK